MPKERFTIVGGAGFVGSRLSSYLRASGSVCATPAKGDTECLEGELGHVIYCAGTTSDFRSRTFDTVDAHVSLVNHLLALGRYLSFTYLSSTRVYVRASTTSEDAAITIDLCEAEDLFNLSKLTGEALCRQYAHRNARSVRLSNVVGANFESNDFLFSIMRDAVKWKHVVLHTSHDSEKDYIHCDDAVELIVGIASRGTQPVYNVASGGNLTTTQVVEAVCQAAGATWSFAPDARTIRFAPIDIGLVRAEFGFEAKPVIPLIRDLTLQALRRLS
jgi:nucleoside-diphosphate-sugar epimerase